MEVIDAITKIDRYTWTTKTGYAGKPKGKNKGTDNLADQWFEGQKEFYLNVAKGFGDERAVDQRGKLLRRVMVKGYGRQP